MRGGGFVLKNVPFLGTHCATLMGTMFKSWRINARGGICPQKCSIFGTHCASLMGTMFKSWRINARGGI